MVAFIILGTGMGIVEVISGLKEVEASDSTHVLWSIIFFVLVALWVREDSNRDGFDKPFDLGFLIYILWPITLPWYLISTRGADGIFMFLGIVLLFIGPWLAGIVAYVYFT